jgi:hypothetical protein
MLGAGTHTVLLTRRGGATILGALTELQRVAWGRSPSATSSATVEIAAPSESCCRALEQVRSWGTEIAIFRDGERVWEGPIIRPRFRGDSVTIEARDPTAWFAKRLIHTAIKRTDVELTELFEDYIRAALRRDNPNLLDWIMRTEDTKVTVDADFEADTTYVMDEMDRLSGEGLLWTMLGRRLIFGNTTSLSQIGPLTQEHFSDPLEVLEDGEAAATRYVMHGAEVTGSAGGVDPYYGLLEYQDTDDQITREPKATATAARRLALTNPPPLRLEEQQATLLPGAPVTMAQLVPGAPMAISLTGVCRPISTLVGLGEVSVDAGPESEAVSIGIAALDIARFPRPTGGFGRSGVTPAAPNYRITEDGDVRITEDGQPRILEGS